MEKNLQQIQNLVLSSVRVGNSDFPIAILPDNMKVHSLEPHNAHRNQFRAGFQTRNFDSLIAYAKQHDQANAQCFINEAHLSAEIVFDIGTVDKPLHAKHRAELLMQKTAAYAALCNFHGQKHDQRTFTDWLEDWGDHIAAYNQDGELMPSYSAVQAIRKLTLDYARNEEHEVSEFAAKKSAMESVEAKSKLELPREFIFTTETYKGLTEQAFTLRLSILTGGNAPLLVARLIKAEQIQEAIAKEFADKLTDALQETGITVNIGTIDI